MNPRVGVEGSGPASAVMETDAADGLDEFSFAIEDDDGHATGGEEDGGGVAVLGSSGLAAGQRVQAPMHSSANASAATPGDTGGDTARSVQSSSSGSPSGPAGPAGPSHGSTEYGSSGGAAAAAAAAASAAGSALSSGGAWIVGSPGSSKGQGAMLDQARLRSSTNEAYSEAGVGGGEGGEDGTAGLVVDDEVRAMVRGT